VKGLVVLHGGSVSIASEGPGRGTEVTVALPTVAPPKSWTNSMISLPKEGPRRVLVIDDNVDGANTLSEALTLLGHDARAAYTGNEGIELAHTFHPDVLICDIGLPDIDGYAVARAFRADEELRSCFLVALSGYAQAQDVERMNEAGFDRNLAKPASIQRFAELLAQVPAQL
jgi:CheY-like chemotaxis protein